MKKLPKTLGACADMLYATRQERLSAQAKVDKMQEQEKILQEHLKLQLAADKLDGVKGKVASVSVSVATVATVKDWDAYWAWCTKKKDFSLNIRKLNDSACRERWENKEVIDGVEPLAILKVSVTKK